jgi:hypothetical protein
MPRRIAAQPAIRRRAMARLRLGDLIAPIKEREHEGDHLTHEVVDLLNRRYLGRFHARRQRRAEDDGRDRPRPLRGSQDRPLLHPDLGDRLVGSGDRRGDVRRRLADHANARPADLLDGSGGFAAQVSGGTTIYLATHFGYPVSTTHVVSGLVLGAGATKRLSAVRWGIAGNIVFAWVLTIPAAALVAAALYWPVEGLF